MANINPFTDAVLAAVQQPKRFPLKGGKQFFLITGTKLRLITTIQNDGEKVAVFCESPKRNLAPVKTAWDANHAVLWDPAEKHVTRLHRTGKGSGKTRTMVPVGKIFTYLNLATN